MFPKLIFGTSALGNLYNRTTHETKKEIIGKIIDHNPNLTVFDSAGKYGAGLALEELGKCLEELGIPESRVSISNKLGWKRTTLTSLDPTFEPGVWKGLRHDAVQSISYDGILECYEQGNNLLGNYKAEVVSIHDPDEYLAASATDDELQLRKENLIAAYRALSELKELGAVSSVGVGAKDSSVIEFLSDHVKLDWAMFANSITPYSHSTGVLGLLDKLSKLNVPVINSAVFNGGFLVGGDHLNYQLVSRKSHLSAFEWRDNFNTLCEKFGIKPSLACVQFSFLFHNINSIALSTSSASRIETNMELVNTPIPKAFWLECQSMELISREIEI